MFGGTRNKKVSVKWKAARHADDPASRMNVPAIGFRYQDNEVRHRVRKEAG